MKKLCIALAASLALLAGCASDGGGTSDSSSATILQAGSHSGLKDQVEKQIHNQLDLDAIWNQIYTGQGTKVPEPTVDFTKDTILVYSTGERKTGGWTMRVDHAAATATGYAIGFTVNQPGNNCTRTINEPSDPFIVVLVPTAGQVTFDEVKTHQIPPCT